jgi:hypothetical protein
MIEQSCLYYIRHLEQSVFGVVMLEEKSGCQTALQQRYFLKVLSLCLTFDRKSKSLGEFDLECKST